MTPFLIFFFFIPLSGFVSLSANIHCSSQERKHTTLHQHVDLNSSALNYSWQVVCAQTSASLAEVIEIKYLHGSDFAVCDSADCCRDAQVIVLPSVRWSNQMFVQDVTYLFPNIHYPLGGSCTLYLLRTSHRAVEALISKQDTFVLVKKTLPHAHSPLP